MRIYAAAGALLGWLALSLQLFLMVHQAPPGALLGSVISFFSFFTILTNLLVAVVLTAVAVRLGHFFRSASMQAATATYIVIVGAVYHLLLRQLWNPQGAQWVADVLLHSAVPVVYVLYWFLFAPRDGLQWRDAGLWLIFPGAYLVYTLARGAAAGVYPYPFVDVNTLGYGGVFLRAGVFLLVFLMVGFLMVAIARWRHGRPSV